MPSASVHKYPLKLVPKQTIKLEDDAIIFPGVFRRSSEPVIYVLGQHKQLTVKTVIRMWPTASKFQWDPLTMTYLGNYWDLTECYHFFKVAEPAP